MARCDPHNPDPYFAVTRFDDPIFVAELLHLVGLLHWSLVKRSEPSPAKELLGEELRGFITGRPGLVMTTDPLFVPRALFPQRGAVPRSDGVVEIQRLDSYEAKARFLAGLLLRYAAHLDATGFHEIVEELKGLIIALRRVVNEPEAKLSVRSVTR